MRAGLSSATLAYRKLFVVTILYYYLIIIYCPDSRNSKMNFSISELNRQKQDEEPKVH
jgi:hypothetical protein